MSFEFAQSFYIQFQAFGYNTGLNRTSELIFIVVCICSELLYSISSVSKCYGTQSKIQVQSYCRLNLLRASVLNFECLYILRDSIEHPSKKLLSLEFSHSFCIQFRMSRYTTGLKGISELKVIAVWICSQLLYSVSSDSIYYVTKSDIRVESYCRLHLLRASTFNFERLDMLRDSIRHPSKKLLSFELAQSFNIQFRASRYITGLNQKSELKVIVVWICSEHQHSISSVSIYYGTQSNIRVKSYCRLNLQRGSTFNFERLVILRDSIRHPSKKLLWFELAESSKIQFLASRYMTGLNQTSE